MNRAVFVDRDGTLNVEKHYLFRREEFEFIQGVPEAIKKLNDAGFLVVVVTNQSGVARGYYEESDVQLLHQYMQQQLVQWHAHIDAFYYCPHHPHSGRSAYVKNCSCRKGAPGMLLTAAREHQIDLSRSYMVGDKLADVEAGLAAGCTTLLVRTGHGEQDQQRVAATVRVYADFGSAVEAICHESS